LAEAELYVFDAYGTLFDVHSAVARHRDAIGPEFQRLSELWRAKQLEYCWVRSLAGAPFRDFEALTAEALEVALARFGLSEPRLRQELLAAYERLDAFPEVAEVLAVLKQAGRRLAILSNGTPRLLDLAIQSAGLRGLFDAVLTVDAESGYKTARPVYARVTDRFGVAPGAVSFQSSNRWDIAGAALAGFSTVWINRGGLPEEYPDCPAGRVLPSLAGLVDRGAR
jgi:2-haloacid dehalogenase